MKKYLASLLCSALLSTGFAEAVYCPSHIQCTSSSGTLSCPVSSNIFSILSQPSDDVAGDYSLYLVINDSSNPGGKENTLCNYVNNYDLKHGPIFHTIVLTDKNGGITRGSGQYWSKDSAQCAKPGYGPGLNPVNCGFVTT